MANKDEKATAEQTKNVKASTAAAKKTAKAETAPAKPAYEYSAEELARTAEIRFGVKPEVVKAAFRFLGIKKATIGGAEKIIKDFLGREVN